MNTFIRLVYAITDRLPRRHFGQLYLDRRFSLGVPEGRRWFEFERPGAERRGDGDYVVGIGNVLIVWSPPQRLTSHARRT